jgi:hypothetical protein
MQWTAVPAILKEIKAPRGHVLEQLTTKDVPAAAQALRRWYPDIVVGAESCHLSPEFYYQAAQLADASGERNVFPIVAKRDGDIVAMITFEKNSLARTLTCRLGAIDPEHRAGGLALLGPLLLEKIGRAIGAEMAYYFATLKSPHQQVLAERARYQLVGIVPAFDRDMVRKGEVKRVFEALYAKVLLPSDGVEVPRAENLTEKTQAVWEAIFGQHPV